MQLLSRRIWHCWRRPKSSLNKSRQRLFVPPQSKLVKPSTDHFTSLKQSVLAKEIVTIVLCAIFLGDYAITHFVLKLVKNSVEHSEADNTEAINKEVCLMLQDRSVFHRRFADAYPEVVYRTERINARMEAIRAETERLRKEAELRAEEMGARISENREQLAARLEPTASVKNTLIEKQAELIELLYQDDVATDEMRTLKKTIEAKNQQLRDRSLILHPFESHSESEA